MSFCYHCNSSLSGEIGPPDFTEILSSWVPDAIFADLLSFYPWNLRIVNPKADDERLSSRATLSSICNSQVLIVVTFGRECCFFESYYGLLVSSLDYHPLPIKFHIWFCIMNRLTKQNFIITLIYLIKQKLSLIFFPTLPFLFTIAHLRSSLFTVMKPALRYGFSFISVCLPV